MVTKKYSSIGLVYQKPLGQFSMYAISLVVMLVCIFNGWDYGILGLIMLYFFYDLGFYLIKDNFAGRSLAETLADIRAACGYISYFIPLLGFLIGFFFSAEKSSQQIIVSIFKTSPLLQYFVIVALVISTTAVLFFPVQYKLKRELHNDGPSPVVKQCFCTIMFLEKTLVTLVCYVLGKTAVSFMLSMMGKNTVI